MIRRALVLVLVAVLLAAGLALYRWLFPPDELAIRRMLMEAAAAASWDGERGAIAQLAAAGQVAAYFAPDVEILLGTGGMHDGVLNGRDAIRRAAVAVRTQTTSMQIELSELEIKIETPGESATVLLEATVRQGGVADPWMQEFRLDVVKREGDWMIRRAQPLRGFGM